MKHAAQFKPVLEGEANLSDLCAPVTYRRAEGAEVSVRPKFNSGFPPTLLAQFDPLRFYIVPRMKSLRF